MYSVQILNKISATGLDLFPQDRYSVTESANEPDAILVRSASLHDQKLPPSVKAIARAGAGVNNIPVETCTQQGVVVFNTPGANANSVKELVVAGLMLTSRSIHEGLSWVESQAGSAELATLVEKQKKQFAGPEVLGKTLGVVGLGAIGAMVANAAVSLGMHVVGFDPFISIDAAWGMSRQVVRADSLDTLLSQADYITVHVPQNDSTKGMVNAQFLGKAKDGVRILNFARGGLVDTAAMVSAVKSGTVARYITDFPEAELVGVPGVLCVPHLGASTPEAEENCAVMAVRQLRAYLESGNIVNSVNFPPCQMDPSENQRILIANRNIPNMVGQITAVLAGEKINIANLLNRHKDELAYNIIDIEGNITGNVLGRLRSIDGVIFVRTIQPVLA
jgi:D-3-phosphoglycerate dehydrogenase / 2-oxoglutarate reductase